MPISTVTLVNTFDQWRIRTNESITVLNNYLDDGVRDASYTYRNLTANVVTSNTVNSETISSNTIFANTILVSNATILNVNTVFLIANLVRSNSVNTTNLVVNQINANSILLTANNMNVDQAIRSSYIQANTGRDHANGAFLTANAAFAAQNVTSDVANASYDQANTARLHANGAFLTANSAFGAQNVTSGVANASFGVANAAFGAQNVTSAVANASFGVANAAFGAQNVTSAVANAAFGVANASFGAQNVTSGVANASFGVANAAFGAQNVTSGVANAAFGVANAAFGAQNVTSAVANAAFSRGNTAVLKTGNTMTGNLVFSGANIAFFASASDGSTLGRGFSNLGIYFSNTAGPGIESAIYANSANIIVFATKKTERVRIDDAGRLNVGTIDIVQFATAAFAVANAATTTGDGGLAAAISAYNAQNVTSGVANAAYDQANTARVHANGAFLTANAAFGSQNVTSGVANAAYNQANTARVHANGAFLTANAAFGQANVAGLQPGIIANAAFAQANSTSAATTIGSAAYDQANTARTHANAAFAQANTASTTAVAGFDAANTKVTKSGDTLTGDLTFTSASNQLLLKVTDGAIEITRSAGGAYIDFKDSSAEDVDVRLTYSSTNLQKVLSGGATSTIWDSGNDGAGSGLDADLLDGQQGSYYAPLSSPTFTGTVTIPTLSVTTGATIVSPTITGTSNTAGATVLSQTLTDGVTVTWDIPKGQIATLTLGGNRTMAAPTNLKVGTFVLHVIQDGTGGRTITWNSVFKWTQGVAPTLSTAIGARDVFSFVCDGTNLYGAMIPDVR